MDPNTRALMMGAAGAAAGGGATYIEDVFSTWLYTGNGSTQTITNGIDLSGKGGLVWIKSRSNATQNTLFDTARGTPKALLTDSTNAEATYTDEFGSFLTNGFTVPLNTIYGNTNFGTRTYASWTFRKAPKFFDVVTFTAGTNSNRRISHSLGSTPGCIILKRTNAPSWWHVYHVSTGRSQVGLLQDAGAFLSSANVWGTADPTSTDFGFNESFVANGANCVAYLFAHDAGGFGDSGNDSVVSCGTFTCDGSGNVGTVNLGWEPQWILTKRTNSTQNWYQWDNMRGWALTSSSTLSPNLADAEVALGGTSYLYPTATGFAGSGNFFGPNAQVIYIAIRRGPMKTPTDATKVFASISATGSTGTSRTTGFPVDMQFRRATGTLSSNRIYDRMRGVAVNSAGTGAELYTDSTSAESTGVSTTYNWWNTGYTENNTYNGVAAIAYNFRRAPGFFDVVAYAGDNISGRSVAHNLGAKPLINMVKRRDLSGNWTIYTDLIDGSLDYLQFDTAAKQDSAQSVPTSTLFYVSNGTNVNSSGGTYISYLFGNVSGVSKCGVYTGTGTTLSIDCGFTAGARFVLIKRTDTTGDWYAWDTARGIISSNDPYLLLNSTAAEVTNTDYIDPLSSGFQISSTAPAAINANGGTFLYLAIA